VPRSRSLTPPTVQDKAALRAEYKKACARVDKLYQISLPDADQSEDWHAARERADMLWKQLRAMDR
jgi:hypothetical protein